MKKFYLLSSAVLLAMSTFAQYQGESGKAVGTYVGPYAPVHSPDRMTCPDTTGLINYTDFLPNFAPTGSLWVYSYTGGGYIYGNNVAGYLNVCAQGYANLNSTPVKVQGAILWFRYKQHDNPSAPATSKVVIGAYAMAANMAYNTDGSGSFNSTVKNWVGPTTLAPLTSVDLLFSAIDTSISVPYNYSTRGNYVSFGSSAKTFLGDFAISLDTRTLAAGDTVGLLCDKKGDAGNLDQAYHLATGYTKWYTTDQVFSPAAAPDLGSGGLDQDIAIFAVLCDATGVEEYFNGMKLAAYPTPATDHATIEYTLEKNSNNVSLKVFDLLGKEIVLKEAGAQAAGTYKFNVETANLPAGNYFYQLRSNGYNFTKKLTVTH